jgi:transcription antitermination protein NusB
VRGRRESRIVALKVLYEIDCVDHPAGVVLDRQMAESCLSKSYSNFGRHLVTGVLKHRDVLDVFIREHAPEWPLEQMAYIDRNILRMAIFEFAVDDETPFKVAINEAVELAKMFGSDSAPRFVNGVLGAVVKCKGEIKQAVEEREGSAY